MSIRQANLIFVVFLFSGAAVARPTQSLWIPQATVLPVKTCRFDLQNQAGWEKDESRGNFYATSSGISCGLFKWKTFSWEGGVDWQENHNWLAKGFTDNLLAHLQIVWLDLDTHGWAVTLGRHFYSPVSNRSNINMDFVMVQSQAKSWRFGLGGYQGNKSKLVDDQATPDATGILFGVWRQVGRGHVAVEWQSGKNLFGYLFFGFGLNLSEKLILASGYGFANNRTTHKDWLLVRMGLLF